MAVESLFPSLLICLLASSATASVEDVCNMASSRNPKIKYDFCVASLKSTPGRGTATNQGFAVIAGNLAVKQGMSTLIKVDSLLKKPPNPRMMIPLQHCHELYFHGIPAVKDATEAVVNHNLEKAKAWFSSAIDAPWTCQNGFEELHLQSPLSQENDAVLQLTYTALAITNTLKK